jgi:hypothetical protein
MPARQTNKPRDAFGATAPAGVRATVETALPAPGSDDELMTRPDTAALLSDLWGGIKVSPRSVASWPIPYRIIGHAALYRRGDIKRHARRKLENAPLRTGGGVAALR